MWINRMRNAQIDKQFTFVYFLDNYIKNNENFEVSP